MHMSMSMHRPTTDSAHPRVRHGPGDDRVKHGHGQADPARGSGADAATTPCATMMTSTSAAVTQQPRARSQRLGFTCRVVTHNVFGLPVVNCAHHEAPETVASGERLAREHGTTYKVYAAQEAWVYAGLGPLWPVAGMPVLSSLSAALTCIPTWACALRMHNPYADSVWCAANGDPRPAPTARASDGRAVATRHSYLAFLSSGLLLNLFDPDAVYHDGLFSQSGLREEWFASKGYMLGTVSDRRVIVCNIHLQAIERPDCHERRIEQVEEAVAALDRFADLHQPQDGAQLRVILGDFNIDTSKGIPKELSARLKRYQALLAPNMITHEDQSLDNIYVRTVGACRVAAHTTEVLDVGSSDHKLVAATINVSFC